MLLWFVFIELTLSVLAGDIHCSTFQECHNKTINCAKNSTCNIYCAEEACSYSTINCPNGYDCNIYLAKYQSCSSSTINGNHATKLFIVTSGGSTGDEQLSQTLINCPFNGTCVIECNNDYHNCRQTHINAEHSISIQLKCVNKNEVCIDSKLYCPIHLNSQCQIEGDTDTTAMTQMNIYSVLGFDTFNVIGTGSSQSIGTMHCLGDYSSYCQIAAPKNNECESTGNDSTCDHPPPPTTTTTTTTQINVTNTTTTTVNTTTTQFNNTNTTIFNTTFTTTHPSRHKIGFDTIDIQYMLLSFTMVVILLILIVINFCKFCDHRSRHMLWRIKFSAMMQMISLFLSYLFWILAVIIRSNCYDLHCIYSKYYVLYMCADTISYTTFVIALMSFYSFMAHRLYYTFSDSIYRMGKKAIYFHVLVTLFIPIWYSILMYYDIDNKNIHFYFTFCSIGLILIFAGLLTLILSFNANLFELLLIQQKEDDDDTVVTLRLITKHTVLGTIILSAGIVCIIMICVLNFLYQKRTDVLWIFYEWLLAFLMIINLVCMHFGFKMYENEYYKICSCCHYKIFKCCKYLVKKRIQRARNDGNYTILSSSFDTL